jgi:hypothetical protein
VSRDFKEVAASLAGVRSALVSLGEKWKVLLICRRYQPDIIHVHLHEEIVIGKVASKLFNTLLIADLLRKFNSRTARSRIHS